MENWQLENEERRDSWEAAEGKEEIADRGKGFYKTEEGGREKADGERKEMAGKEAMER